MGIPSKLLATLAFLVILPSVGAADVKLLPAEVRLAGPHASQRLILLSETGGKFHEDVTAKATFATSNPAVAAVTEAGIVRPVGDGEAIITATLDGTQATAKVKVTKARVWILKRILLICKKLLSTVRRLASFSVV